jgi:hypothetical protein
LLSISRVRIFLTSSLFGPAFSGNKSPAPRINGLAHLSL